MIRLFRFLKVYWALILADIGLLFAQVMMQLVRPNKMRVSGMKGFEVFAQTQDKSQAIDAVWKASGDMFLLVGGILVSALLTSLISARIASGFGARVRFAMFSHVERFSLAEFDQISTSSLITRNTNDIQQVQTTLIFMFNFMISAPITCIVGLLKVLDNGSIAAVFAVVIPLMLIVMVIAMLYGLPLFKKMQVKLDRVNRVLREKLTGIRVIRAFNKEKDESDRFNTANKDLTSTALKVNMMMAVMMPVIILIISATNVAILWIGSHQADVGAISSIDLSKFMQYAVQILMSFIMMTVVFIMIPRAAASATRINQVLDMTPSIQDNSHSLAPAAEENSVKGLLEFRNVSFYYPNPDAAKHKTEGKHGAEKALDSISFVSRPGEITAFIGSTGSGKSTIANLIERFYDISEGQILLNGMDIKDYTQEQLRQRIGIVPQKALLFSGTVAENVRYGKQDATDDEIMEACKIAQAHDFISKMENGYESHIAQGGTNVSGGQKQRLCIARALVRRPGLYIFDDSFSALDYKTDSSLRTALKENIKDATILIIGQRVSSIMNSDQIVVLDEGKMIGKGTHKELMQSCQIYQEIVASQLSEKEYTSGGAK